MGKKNKKKTVPISDSDVREKKNKNKEKPGYGDSYDHKDSRFAAASNRPQFLPQSKKSNANKVQIDDRFASVLTDPRFRVDGMGSGGVDKYGRKKKKKKSKDKNSDANYGVEDELSAFYTVEKKTDTEVVSNSGDEDSEPVSDEDDDNKEEAEERKEEELKPKDTMSRIAYLQALSRGEISGDSSSESSSEDEDDSDSSVSTSDSDNDDEDPLNVTPGILDPSTKQKNEEDDPIDITTESSPYLAVLNLDWVHVRAVDIFVILSSFSPPGSVKRVRVYPSDFGMERMKEEEVMGPTGIWKNDKKKKQNKSDHPEEEVDSDNSDESESEEDRASSDEEEDAEAIIDKAYKSFPRNEHDAGENPGQETDFDTEKLRAYEASKLRYYFAVAEFNSSKDADMAYREVDGLEMEHSSAAFDLRCIPQDGLSGAIENRQLRDEALSVPSNYIPPEFVVNALQQTNVKCTWEDGDVERTRKLTQYGVGNEMWDAMVEGDDLKAYLASDNSSDEEDEDSNDEGEGKKKKGSKMRALLGLSGDEDSDDNDLDKNEQSDDDKDFESGTKEVTYIPGKQDLSEKIREKIKTKQNEEDANLTPWEQFLEKRREKKREKRKAKRERLKNGDEIDDNVQNNVESNGIEDDDFFLQTDTDKKNRKASQKRAVVEEDSIETETRAPSSKEELELILAGDNDVEAEKDYDMRGLLRIEKNAGKKLRGARKRKESKIRENVAGQDFKIDTTDKRFAALLEGDDRFGIDRQDPNYKETAAMKDILAEQTKRRSKKRNREGNSGEQKIYSKDANQNESDGKELGSLVLKLKNKVEKAEKKKKKRSKKEMKN